jgi:hypothetical protein
MIYCKAYPVESLKAFEGWGGPGVEGLADDEVCYVWEDFVLTRSCLDEERQPLFEVTDEWKAFCTDTLKFSVPDDVKG